MNIVSVIILVTLAISFVLDLIADRLNLNSLNTEVPEEFKGIYDEETYANSQEYTREKTKFGMIVSFFNLGLLLGFWFSGGFNMLDVWVRAFDWGVILTGVFYIGILAIGKSLLTLPFSMYSTFVIEEKFGFNKTSISTFIADLFKGLLLTILLGGPLIALLIAFFQYAGELAWLYAWISVSLISLLLQFIAPTWIMPLFNKFEDLKEGELKTAIDSYSEKVSFPLKGVFVMDGSKRSSKSNAFFTGFGKNKRIALFDTLINNHSVSELVAVLAHEVGHYKKKHIIQNMVISILHTGALFFLLSLFLGLDVMYEAFYMEVQSVYTAFIFFGMLYSPVEMMLSIFMQISSRKHEFEADQYAAETIEEPEDMVAVLKGLSKDNLSNLTPHPFYVFLNYSHPPVLKRIEAIRSYAKTI